MSAVYGYLLYKDFIDLKENFPSKEKLFLLKDGEQYIAGFSATELSIGDSGSKNSAETSPKLPTKPISKEKLVLYSGKKTSEILEDRYKIIILDADMFKKLKRIMLPEEMEFTGKELVSLIKKEDSFKAFAEFMAQEQLKKRGISLGSSSTKTPEPGIDKQQIIGQIKESFNIKDEESFDSLVLIFMIMGTMQEQGPIFLVEQFKAGNIAVYPETIIFKSVKLIPKSAFEYAAQKVAGKLETDN